MFVSSARQSHLGRLAAIVAASVLAACASTEIDPTTNSVNRTLNAGGQVVTGSISAMNRDQIRAIATSLPVCIAYQLPATSPALNDTFKQTLADVTRTLPVDDKLPVTISVYQAQMKRVVSPLSELVALKSIMPPAFKNTRMYYQPLPPAEFRKRANCPGKESILVVGTDTSFYRKELPLATVAAGELPIDTVLFLVIGLPPGSATGIQDSRRSS